MPAEDKKQEKNPNSFEHIAGVNTSTTRAGVGDNYAFWLDGFMPVADRRLRTLPGTLLEPYSTTPGNLLFFFGYNISTTTYIAIAQADGSIQQFNLVTKAITQILPPGTVTGISLQTVGFTQYGQQYLIIVSSKQANDNGYWVWDGTLLYTNGTIGPQPILTNVGAGYSSTPTAVAVGGSGSGATFSVTEMNGIVSNVSVTNPGSGYLPMDGPSVSLSFSGGSPVTPAAGYVNLMPFGVQGNAVQTYQNIVWVFDGNSFEFSAPGSISNFATSAGGGSRQSNANYLKFQYTNAVSTNGFLFLVGDSSMDYISGVVTSGSVTPTTTFTQNNSDPQIGSSYAYTVTTYGSDIYVANTQGVWVSSGGTFLRISEPMDGVFNSVPAIFLSNAFNGFQLSAAKAQIFGKLSWMVLVPIIDPVKNVQVNKLLIVREKKIWWASEQDVPLTFIGTVEINSTIGAFGTDGTSLYVLFYQPSTAFVKTAQSKLWDEPGGIEFNKAVSRFWSEWQYNSMSSPSVSLTVDAIGIDASGNQYTNAQGYGLPGAASVGFYSSLPLAVGQQGIFTGITLKTSAADVDLIVAKLGVEVTGERT